MSTAVSIIKCEDYTPSRVLKAVKEAVDLLGGMEKFVTPGQKVLVKPNLLAIHPPEAAVCTHPAVVEAVTSLAIASGAKCSIGDSPCIGAETPGGYKRLLDVTGIKDAADRIGASTVRFDDGGTEREVPDARAFRRITLSSALDDADALINVCKLKTHELTLLTGAVKNLFGCIPGRRKIEFHLQAGDDPETFAQVLVDILRAVRPRLSIMDGIVGMDGQGPAAGRRRNFGIILASEDPVALDAVACSIAGINPMDIPALRLASEQGVGIADLSQIEIVGASVDDVRIEDFQLPPRGDLASRMPKPLFRMFRNQLIRKPVFIKEKCTGCRSCAETCPVSAIGGDDLKIDYGKCIRCYCCQEVCPEEAISVRSTPIRRILESLSIIK